MLITTISQLVVIYSMCIYKDDLMFACLLIPTATLYQT